MMGVPLLSPPVVASPAPMRVSVRAPAPRLVAVTGESDRSGRTSFVLVVVGMLSVGLAALLGVNTALAQNSFKVNILQKRAGELADRAASLQEALARSNSPERLEADARRLGMVSAPGVTYVRLADSSLSGVPNFAGGDPVAVTPEQQAVFDQQAAQAKAKADAAKAKADAVKAKAEAKAAAERAKAEARAAAEAQAARLAAQQAAAKAAAERAAAAQRAWEDKLAAQEAAGAKGGGAMVVAPPEGERG